MCHKSGRGKGLDKGNLTVQGLLMGGPFYDGLNWWQLTTFEGFLLKHFSSFFSPSSVEVLSQCATCINKN